MTGFDFQVWKQKHLFFHRVFRRSREYSARSVVLRSHLLHVSFEAISENSELLSDEIATAATETVRYVLDLQWAEEATDLQRSILQHRYAAITSFSGRIFPLDSCRLFRRRAGRWSTGRLECGHGRLRPSSNASQ